MIEISFKGDTPLEALSKAAAFGLHAAEDKLVLNAAKQIMAAEERARVQAPTSVPIQTPAPAAETPAEAPTPAAPGPDPAAGVPAAAKDGRTAPLTEAPTAPSAPAPSADELKKKGKDAVRKYGRDAVLPLLQEFHVSRITEIPEQERAAFIARLEGLGDANA